MSRQLRPNRSLHPRAKDMTVGMKDRKAYVCRCRIPHRTKLREKLFDALLQGRKHKNPFPALRNMAEIKSEKTIWTD